MANTLKPNAVAIAAARQYMRATCDAACECWLGALTAAYAAGTELAALVAENKRLVKHTEEDAAWLQIVRQERDALAAQVATLRKALRLFAENVANDGYYNEAGFMSFDVTPGDLRQAQAAFRATAPKKP